MSDMRAPRTSRISRSDSVRRSRPSNMTRPPVMRPGGCSRRRIEKAVTDFPLPDSPTRPSVSPGAIWKLTPSTALAGPPKATVRSWTSRSINETWSDFTWLENSDQVSFGLILAEHAAQGVGDLADGGAAFDGGDDHWHQVLSAACRPLDGVQGGAPLVLAAAGAHGADTLHLLALDVRVDAEHAGAAILMPVSVPVHADDDRGAGVDGLLRPVGRVLDLPLNDAGLDGAKGAPGRVDPIDQCLRLALEAAGHRLDRVRAADRIDGVRRPAFMQDDLLRAEREGGALLGRKRQCLVLRVAMQRLRPAQNRRERLQRDADNVVVRLLGGERAAGSLRVKAQLLGAGIGHAEPVPHDPGPEAPRRAELCNLLEEIVVGVEEERQPLPEHVRIESRRDTGFDVGDGIGEREPDLLRGRRARFADVIAAD